MVHFDVKRKEVIQKFHDLRSGKVEFDQLASELFLFQRDFNPVYSRFLTYLGKADFVPESVEDIPFLPIESFKKHEVKTGDWEAERVFMSSGTTKSDRSLHFLKNNEWYDQNTRYCFENTFGNLDQFRFYGLLPSYLEQGNSSLVHMVSHFMNTHPDAHGGFFMYDQEELIKALDMDQKGRKPLLFGVSYALLDLAISKKPDLSHVLIFETGGMKGRGKELAREALHQLLCKGLNVKKIYSEYGMTELLSQAYSRGKGIFETAPTMRIRISDPYDPKATLPNGHHGRLDVIDLANIDSCAFIATQDVGVLLDHQRFSVLGRTDDSDIRGCNLLYV